MIRGRTREKGLAVDVMAGRLTAGRLCKPGGWCVVACGVLGWDLLNRIVGHR